MVQKLITDVLELFRDVACTSPDRTAIIHNGRAIDYRELLDRVRALAHDLGPDPGMVGVLVDRSPGTIVALLATLAAGGAYCPIDVGFPDQRKRTMAAAIGAERLVRAHPGLSLPEGLRPHLPEIVPARGGASESVVVQPDHPAYVLFTSGSSGTPKPVLTPRRAIAASVRSLTAVLDLSPEDRVLQFTALSWDTCFEEILPALTTGASLVIDDEAYAGSLPRFMRMLAAQGITVLDLPTAMWHELVLYLVDAHVGLPECVRTIVIGGEAVSPARLAQWEALATGHIRLVNTYGCTETTLVTHAVDISGPRAADDCGGWRSTGKVPIGRPVAHVRQRVTASGELLIGGPGLATGYLGQAGKTAEAFVDHDGTRWFRTGDRVSETADELVVFHGRLDAEFKIRGVRVAPGEVEATIVEHPQIDAVAVVGVEASGRTALVAYVVPRDGAGAVALRTDVVRHVRDRLPSQFVPSRVVVVPRLSQTASGKVDRAATHHNFKTKHSDQARESR